MDVLMRVRRLPAIISVARLLRWNRLSVIEYVMELPVQMSDCIAFSPPGNRRGLFGIDRLACGRRGGHGGG